jgi:hypothetical protein
MPALNGSAALAKTIGIVAVAALAAFAGSAPPVATRLRPNAWGF